MWVLLTLSALAAIFLILAVCGGGIVVKMNQALPGIHGDLGNGHEGTASVQPTNPRSVTKKIERAQARNEAFLDLSHTQVSDLTPLAGLVRLKALNLSHTQVSDLTPLAGLTGLENLWLHYTQVSDITPLAGLVRLKVLYLYHTQVSDLTPLARLTGLEKLWIPPMQGSDLSPLRGLTEVRKLCIANDQSNHLAMIEIKSLLSLLRDAAKANAALPGIHGDGAD
jgi:hypothetical protein